MTESPFAIKQEARGIMMNRGVTFFLTVAAYLVLSYLLSYLIEMISGYYDFLVSYYNAVEKGGDLLASLTWPSISPVALLLSGAIYLMILMLSAGYQYYLLGACRENEISIKDLFESFNCTGKVLVITLLRTLAIGLGSILFIIPGVIISYRYRMALYVMYDNPSLGPVACLKESARIMQGQKKALFILDMSFLGWMLASNAVAMIALPVLEIFVSPYSGLAEAIFYRELTAPESAPEEPQSPDIREE